MPYRKIIWNKLWFDSNISYIIRCSARRVIFGIDLCCTVRFSNLFMLSSACGIHPQRSRLYLAFVRNKAILVNSPRLPSRMISLAHIGVSSVVIFRSQLKSQYRMLYFMVGRSFKQRTMGFHNHSPLICSKAYEFYVYLQRDW